MTKEVLENLLEEKKYKSIHDVLSHYNPVDLANLLEEFEEERQVLIFRMIAKDKAAEVFSYMDNDLRQLLVRSFTKQEVKNILDSMFTDDAVDFLSDMPANVVAQLLENVDSETRADINHLLQYPDDSAGSIMTIEFVELNPKMTVKEALEKIRITGINSETVYTCYVVEKHKLLGIVSAKDLMTSDSEVPIIELMHDNFISVKTIDDKEYAANLFRKYGLIAIPVVDSEGCIVGIVTFDDAIDVMTEETTEDMHKMAAMTSSDEPYLKTSVWEHAKNRVLWLIILMLTATVTGTIITNFQGAVSKIPLLVSFIPMIMNTSGNSGSQSSVLIIRGLAVDEIKFSDTLKVMWKEIRVGLIVGVALSIVTGIWIFLIYNEIRYAYAVSGSLMFTIVGAKLCGCLLPILAKKLKLDPAIMAAPLITTIVDAFSTMVYLNIAIKIFGL